MSAQAAEVSDTGKIKQIFMKYLTVLFFFLSLNIAFAQGQKIVRGEYQKRTFTHQETELNYQILYPKNFDKSRKYPLVLFLHGAGERGDDNEKQLAHGSKLFRDSMEKYPAIVLFPQCKTDDYWALAQRPNGSKRGGNFNFKTDQPPAPSMAATMALVEKMLGENYTDNDRFYVTGLSMGGMGTFELCWRMPEKIAAAMPICGGGPRPKAKEMTSIPFWVFHGVKDDIVHPRLSTGMVKSIQQAGGKAKISLYPDANHNSWDRAFAEPEFLAWMFAQKKAGKG